MTSLRTLGQRHQETWCQRVKKYGGTDTVEHPARVEEDFALGLATGGVSGARGRGARVLAAGQAQAWRVHMDPPHRQTGQSVTRMTTSTVPTDHQAPAKAVTTARHRDFGRRKPQVSLQLATIG